MLKSRNLMLTCLLLIIVGVSVFVFWQYTLVPNESVREKFPEKAGAVIKSLQDDNVTELEIFQLRHKDLQGVEDTVFDRLLELAKSPKPKIARVALLTLVARFEKKCANETNYVALKTAAENYNSRNSDENLVLMKVDGKLGFKIRTGMP